MAQQSGEFGFLAFGIVLLVTAVLSVPIARKIGLPAIGAYLVGGMIIGPSGLALFATCFGHSPVQGHGRGAAACALTPARAWKRKPSRRFRPRRTGSGAHCGGDCAHRPGRPLSAQSILSTAGPEWIARGDDCGRA